MMNFVALFLVLSSLVTAGLWSPPPLEKHANPTTQDVIAKNGHQKLIVEFDKGDGKFKVSISPQESLISSVLLDDKCYVRTAKDELSTRDTHTAAAVEDYSKQKYFRGALDKCREKARAVEERVKEAAFEVPSKACELKDEAKDVIRAASEKAKERAWEKAHEAKEAVEDVTQIAKEKISDKAKEAKEKVSEKAGQAKERAWEKAQEAKEAVGDATQIAKEKISDKAKEAKEKASEKAQEVKEALEKAQDGEKDLKEIVRRGRELGYDVLVYVVPSPAVEAAAGVAHLVGFAAAYGMCLWVTFVSSYVLAGALERKQFGVVQSKIYPVYFRTMAYCVALALFAHLLSHRKRMLANYRGVEVFLGFNLLASLVMILFNLLYLEPRATKVMFERMKLEKEEGGGRESSISESISKAAADPTADWYARGADVASTPFSKGGQGRDSSVSEPGSKSAAGPTADSAAIPTRSADATSAPPLRPEELEQVAARAQMVELGGRLKKLNAYSSFLNILTLMLLTWHLVYLGQHLHVSC